MGLLSESLSCPPPSLQWKLPLSHLPSHGAMFALEPSLPSCLTPGWSGVTFSGEANRSAASDCISRHYPVMSQIAY